MTQRQRVLIQTESENRQRRHISQQRSQTRYGTLNQDCDHSHTQHIHRRRPGQRVERIARPVPRWPPQPGVESAEKRQTRNLRL